MPLPHERRGQKSPPIHRGKDEQVQEARKDSINNNLLSNATRFFLCL